MGDDPDEARAARGAVSDSEQKEALQETLYYYYAWREMRSEMKSHTLQKIRTKSGFWLVPIKFTIHYPILQYQPANCLHVALILRNDSLVLVQQHIILLSIGL